MLESIFNKVAKETPTQAFSGEYCEIFENSFFSMIEHLRQLLLSLVFSLKKVRANLSTDTYHIVKYDEYKDHIVKYDE